MGDKSGLDTANQLKVVLAALVKQAKEIPLPEVPVIEPARAFHDARRNKSSKKNIPAKTGDTESGQFEGDASDGECSWALPLIGFAILAIPWALWKWLTPAQP